MAAQYEQTEIRLIIVINRNGDGWKMLFCVVLVYACRRNITKGLRGLIKNVGGVPVRVFVALNPAPALLLGCYRLIAAYLGVWLH